MVLLFQHVVILVSCVCFNRSQVESEVRRLWCEGKENLHPVDSLVSVGRDNKITDKYETNNVGSNKIFPKLHPFPQALFVFGLFSKFNYCSCYCIVIS